jgi:hypothetical protein
MAVAPAPSQLLVRHDSFVSAAAGAVGPPVVDEKLQWWMACFDRAAGLSMARSFALTCCDAVRIIVAWVVWAMCVEIYNAQPTSGVPQWPAWLRVLCLNSIWITSLVCWFFFRRLGQSGVAETQMHRIVAEFETAPSAPSSVSIPQSTRLMLRDRRDLLMTLVNTVQSRARASGRSASSIRMNLQAALRHVVWSERFWFVSVVTGNLGIIIPGTISLAQAPPETVWGIPVGWRMVLFAGVWFVATCQLALMATVPHHVPLVTYLTLRAEHSTLDAMMDALGHIPSVEDHAISDRRKSVFAVESDELVDETVSETGTGPKGSLPEDHGLSFAQEAPSRAWDSVSPAANAPMTPIVDEKEAVRGDDSELSREHSRSLSSWLAVFDDLLSKIRKQRSLAQRLSSEFRSASAVTVILFVCCAVMFLATSTVTNTSALVLFGFSMMFFVVAILQIAYQAWFTVSLGRLTTRLVTTPGGVLAQCAAIRSIEVGGLMASRDLDAIWFLGSPVNPGTVQRVATLIASLLLITSQRLQLNPEQIRSF